MIFLRDFIAKLGDMSAIFTFRNTLYGIDLITSDILL